MTNEQFDALVARLSREATARPLWYKTRVFLFAILGYAYVFGILALLLVIVGGAVYVVSTGRGLRLIDNVAIPLALFVWFVGKALWVKFEPPEGRELRREQAPRLFAAIDEICRQLRAPRADVVLVDDDYNAAVAQYPRLGVFGFHRNYLILGLPYMAALTPDEFRGTLAHEFAHLSRAHARFGNWVYRVRRAWYQLMEALEKEKEGRGSWLFKRFFHWYAPYFGAYSFVLARNDEYEADRLAATVVGPLVKARGLLRGMVRSRTWDEFWATINRQVITNPEPPTDVYTQLSQALRAPLEPAVFEEWASDELARETGSTDTHPATRERIAAVGVSIEQAMGNGSAPSTAVHESAAEHFLGDLAPRITAELNGRWKGRSSARWREQHERERREEARLAELAERRGSLEDGELWELADLTDSRRGPAEAEPLLRELLARNPRHAAAAYSLGYNLLQADDAEGIGLIETAMEVDPQAIAPGSRLIAAFHDRQGQTSDAERYQERAATARAIEAESAHERDAVYRSDSFLPHELDGAALAGIRGVLASHPRVKRAWVARKAVKHKPEQPVFVLGFDTGFDWRLIPRAFGIRLSAPRDPLVDALASTVPFPGEGFVVNLHSNNAWLKRKLKQVTGSEVYRGSAVSSVVGVAPSR